METKTFFIGGMTCVNCQNKISRGLRGIDGVKKAAVSYKYATAEVTFNPELVTPEIITAVIESLDYRVLKDGEKQSGVLRAVGLLAVIIALFVLLDLFGVLNLLVPSKLSGGDGGMGYFMLFAVGLLTSVHCIAMCGGINLSQCIPKSVTDCPKTSESPENTRTNPEKSRFSAFVPALLYNAGRVVSYTGIGFALGFAGFAIGGGNLETAGVPVVFQGALKLLAGVLMVIMGANMLCLFPFLRKLQPRTPKFLQKLAEKASGKTPLIVGLLNGFMPCGPLQSIQIIALASGNPFVGALTMLMFSMGTVPLMLGLGSIVSALGKKFTKSVMTVGAVLVTVLGLAMFSQGWALADLPVLTFVGGNQQDLPEIIDGVQIINSTLSPNNTYPDITVRAGVPVKWVFTAPEGSISGCNDRFIIGEYDIEHTFKYGENIIEFTPVKKGTFQYSCWMGMIKATITVV